MSLQITATVEALCQLLARYSKSEGKDEVPLCIIANRIEMDEW
jgi:hypothetical protein